MEEEGNREAAESVIMKSEENRSVAAWEYVSAEKKAQEMECVLLHAEDEYSRLSEQLIIEKGTVSKALSVENAGRNTRDSENDVRIRKEAQEAEQPKKIERKLESLETAKSVSESTRKSHSVVKQAFVPASKKKGNSWGGFLKCPDPAPLEERPLEKVESISSEEAVLNDYVCAPNFVKPDSDVSINENYVFPDLDVTEVVENVEKSYLASNKRSKFLSTSCCCIGGSSKTPYFIQLDVCCPAVLLYRSYLNWKKWLSEQSSVSICSFMDSTHQNHFMDTLQNIHRRDPLVSSNVISECTVENLGDVEFLAHRTDLKHLILNVNRISTLSPLSPLKEMDSLSVKDNKLKNLDGLQNMQKLRALVLDVNQVNDMSAIESLQSIVLLSASTNHLTEVPRLDSPYLQRLNLYHNNISTVSSLASIKSRVLTHLDLGRNKLKYISGEALSQCQLLTQLILSQNALENVPYPLRLPNLRRLWISGNRVCGLNEWAPVEDENGISCPCFLPLLEKLFLQDNSIRSLSSRCFSSMPLLAHLDLSFNNLGDSLDSSSIAADLVSIKDCKLLRSIQLQDNPLTSHTHSLSSYLLSICPNLTEISGSGTCPTEILPSIKNATDVVISLDNLLSGRNIRKISTSSKPLDVSVLMHPYSGATNAIETSHLKGFFKDLSGMGVNHVGDAEISRRFYELICSINTASVSEKIVSKYEKKNLRQNQVNSSGNSHFYDPLSNGGVEPFSSVEFLVHALSLLKSWTSIKPKDNVQSYLVRTINCNGDPGCISEASLRDEAMSLLKPSFASSTENINNAVNIQRFYRGYRIRQQIKAALERVRYEDDDLNDAIFSENIMEEWEFPELEDAYWKVDKLHGVATEAGLLPVEKNTVNSVVYGDHIRARGISSRNSSRQTSSTGSVGIETLPNNMATNFVNNENVQVKTGWAEAVSRSDMVSGELDITEDENEFSQFSSRPPTNMSDMSVASSQAHSVDEHEYIPDHMSSKSTPRTNKLQVIADEWGLSNPQAIAAMKKRNKRLK